MPENKCYRCGMCCRGYIAIVPKNKDSNLSPEYIESFIENHGFDYALSYIDENSELMGDPCKWLIINEDGLCSCSVYENRSSDCRNYPGGDCKVGKTILNRRLNGL